MGPVISFKGNVKEPDAPTGLLKENRVSEGVGGFEKNLGLAEGIFSFSLARQNKRGPYVFLFGIYIPGNQKVFRPGLQYRRTMAIQPPVNGVI